MLRVLVQDHGYVESAVFLQPVASAVDVVLVDASMHVLLAVDAIHVELPLLGVLLQVLKALAFGASARLGLM